MGSRNNDNRLKQHTDDPDAVNSLQEALETSGLQLLTRRSTSPSFELLPFDKWTSLPPCPSAVSCDVQAENAERALSDPVSSSVNISSPALGTKKLVVRTMAAAIVPLLLPMLEPVLEPIYEGLKASLRDGLKNLEDKFHQKHPGQTFWAVLKGWLTKWATDNHVEQNILNKLRLTSFVAHVSDYSHQLLEWVNKDPNVQTQRDFAIHWDAKKIAAAAGVNLERAKIITTKIFHEEPTATIQGKIMDNTVRLDNGSSAVKGDVVNALAKMGSKAMADQSPAAEVAKNPSIVDHIPPSRVGTVVGELRRLAAIQSMSESVQAFETLSNQDRNNSLTVSKIPEREYVAKMKNKIGAKEAKQVHANAVIIRAKSEKLMINLLQYVKGTGLAAIDGQLSIKERMREVQLGLGPGVNLETLFGSMDQLITTESASVYGAASYLVDLLEYLRNTGLTPVSNQDTTPSNTMSLEISTNSNAKKGGPSNPTAGDVMTSSKIEVRDDDLDSVAPAQTGGGSPDNFSNTVLELLFRRRPDIGNLLLTVENTDTSMPFIDISNEIMESFIVHLTSYENNGLRPRQAQIEAFDVGVNDESDELLAQPQNVDMAAYRELAAASYPMVLPYSHPLDMQRTFLQLLKVTRADLADAFRPRIEDGESVPKNKTISDQDSIVAKWQKVALDNQVACERLGLIQEDFLILTKNVFWPLEFFQVTEGITLTLEQYQADIGLKPTHECWGYSKDEYMLSTEDKKQTGLCWLENQLLRRAGVSFTDVIGIVQTDFINPDYPTGQDKIILESLRFSYRFLQTLVDPDYSTPTKRYQRLIDFLVQSTKVIDLGTLLQQSMARSRSGKLSDNAANGQPNTQSFKSQVIKEWVLANFEKMGKITVLDSGEGPMLEVYGRIFAATSVPVTSTTAAVVTTMAELKSDSQTAAGRIVDRAGNALASGWIANLAADGTVTDLDGHKVGYVLITGRVIYGNPIDDYGFNDAFKGLLFSLVPTKADDKRLWNIENSFLQASPTIIQVHGTDKLQVTTSKIIEWEQWQDLGGSGNISNVRLQHLDGTSLSVKEWDRLHRFIRIWVKLGWSVSDTDRALSGMSAFDDLEAENTMTGVTNGTGLTSGTAHQPRFKNLITFADFVDPIVTHEDVLPPSPTPARPADITPVVIRELAAVHKLLPMFSLTLEQLLTMWTTISYKGPTSIFYRLFFARGLRNTDSAFVADPNGNYLPDPNATIKDHILTIAAALGLQVSDIDYMLTPPSDSDNATLYSTNTLPVPVSNILSIETISEIYRYMLFAKIFGVQVADVGDIVALFTDPSINKTYDMKTDEMFGDPIKEGPSVFLRDYLAWQQMKSVGISWAEFRYIVDSVPTPTDPLAPSQMDSLLLAQTLRNGIMQINKTYPAPTSGKITDDMVTSSAALVFDDTTVTKILNLIHGRTVSSALCPVLTDKLSTLVNNIVPERNFQYVYDNITMSASISFIGILNDQQIALLRDAVPLDSGERWVISTSGASQGIDAAGKASIHDQWSVAIDSACSQSVAQCEDLYFQKLAIFLTAANGRIPDVLLAPDTSLSTPPQANGIDPRKSADTKGQSTSQTPAPATQNSKPQSVANSKSRNDELNQPKAYCILQSLIPFLRNRLIHTFIVDTIVTKAGFTDRSLGQTMLDSIITVDYYPQLDSNVPSFLQAMAAQDTEKPSSSENALPFLQKTVGAGPELWRGYLQLKQPESASYVFYLTQEYFFEMQHTGLEFGLYARATSTQVGPIREWMIDEPSGMMATEKVLLSNKTSYMLQLPRVLQGKLQWKVNDQSVAAVPADLFIWQGYLSPPSTDTYVFSMVVPSGGQIDASMLSVVLDSQVKALKLQPSSSSTYCTDPIYLNATNLHTLQFPDVQLLGLQWRSTTAPRADIPDSCLISNFAGDRMQALFTTLTKMALLLKHFSLGSDEVLYIHEHNKRFACFNFERLANILQWTRLCNYVQLRDSLPKKARQSLLGLFGWAEGCIQAKQAVSAKTVQQQVTSTTSWPAQTAMQILQKANFLTGTTEDFVNESLLLRMQQLVTLSTQLGVQPTRLFKWAQPMGTASSDFYQYVTNAQDIQKVVQSRFSVDDWMLAIRPLNNALRENRKQALIAYLVSQEKFVKDNNIVDADSLFEFFLIDVQTGSLVETTRIKQAIASVQTFVQRCMLGMENDPSKYIIELDANRWNWMSRYRVWEANRKIFLYPENWIDPSIRDDMTEFFQQLQSALLQKNLSEEVVQSAIRSYVFSVDQVANLKAIGVYLEFKDPPKYDDLDKIHVVARTRVAPYTCFYNYFTVNPVSTATNKSEKQSEQMPSATVASSKPGTGSGNLPTKGPSAVTADAKDKHGKGKDGNDGDMEPSSQDDLLAEQDPTEARKAPIGSWYSWHQMQVDIPHYTTQPLPTAQSATSSSPIVGSHVALTMFSCRLLLFVAQVVSKTITSDPFANSTASIQTSYSSYTSTLAHESQPRMTWDVSLTWTELRDGRWTQRVTCPQSFTDPGLPSLMYPGEMSKDQPPVEDYCLVPSLITSDTPALDPVAVKVYLMRQQQATPLAEWVFNGTTLSLLSTTTAKVTLLDPPDRTKAGFDTVANLNTTFGIRNETTGAAHLHSMQAIEGSIAVDTTIPVSAYIDDADDRAFASDTKGLDQLAGPQVTLALSVTQSFYHKHIHALAAAANGQADLSSLFTQVLNSDAVVKDQADMFGATGNAKATYYERESLYSIYNWELGFHAPMIVVDRLFKAQQYETALKVCQYVFNPNSVKPGAAASGAWIFAPFRKLANFQQSLEAAMSQDWQVNDWRNNAMQPHVVARDRPQCYMKWVVMVYIRILTAFGDSLFQQNTLESVQMAVQYYVLASHLYGPRGQQIPRQDKVQPCSYNDLTGKFNNFSNPIVALEQAYPFSNQTTLPVGTLPFDTVLKTEDMLMASIFGFAGTYYFSIPDNDVIRALASTIDDRLFKIRHSQDINGVTRILPNFEPPIDPALLVQAAAQGLSLSSVVASLNCTIANCRFQPLLEKALELTGEVKSMGQALLSIREKNDSEAVAIMQAQHELALNNSVMEQKKFAVDEANASLIQLQYSRASPVSRLSYFLKQIGSDLSGVPTLDQEYQELDAKIDSPQSEGGLFLSPNEVEAMNKAALANDLNGGIAALELTAGIFHSIPNVQVDGLPFGIGATVCWGPENMAAVASTAARGLKIGVDSLDWDSSNAKQTSQYQRVLQDRILQANSAGYEVSNIDKQITVSKIRIAMANKDIDVQQKQIDCAQELRDYLRDKYTNTELYSWMDGQMKSLYYQTYAQAMTMAMKAQKAFDLERPNRPANSYIQQGYWDTSRDGFFSGEKLYLALKQLEAAAVDDRSYTFEVTKSVSLRQNNPMALISLREAGSCNFAVPEVLYDMDFPGHYLRRIKSVSVTIPCVVGPYTSINATLTLGSSKIRCSADVQDGYAEKDSGSGSDNRFIVGTAPLQAIAVCNGQNDPGAFQLDFSDNAMRYLPFEGAGADSNWSLQLPPIPNFRQFSYDSITDVILTIRYTSLDGGAELQNNAVRSVKNFVTFSQSLAQTDGLSFVVDVKNDFASAWTRLVRQPQPQVKTDNSFALKLLGLNDRLPVYAQPPPSKQVLAQNVWLVMTGPFSNNPAVQIAQADGSNPLSKDGDPDTDTLKAAGAVIYKFTVKPNQSFPLDSWEILFGSDVSKVTKCWMFIRYVFQA